MGKQQVRVCMGRWRVFSEHHQLETLRLLEQSAQSPLVCCHHCSRRAYHWASNIVSYKCVKACVCMDTYMHMHMYSYIY